MDLRKANSVLVCNKSIFLMQQISPNQSFYRVECVIQQIHILPDRTLSASNKAITSLFSKCHFGRHICNVFVSEK